MAGQWNQGNKRARSGEASDMQVSELVDQFEKFNVSLRGAMGFSSVSLGAIGDCCDGTVGECCRPSRTATIGTVGDWRPYHPETHGTKGRTVAIRRKLDKSTWKTMGKKGKTIDLTKDPRIIEMVNEMGKMKENLVNVIQQRKIFKDG